MSVTTNFPLLFNFTFPVVGHGFTALVRACGRVLMSVEDEEVWLYGVEPGGIAARGDNRDEAYRGFRQTFLEVVQDVVNSCESFPDFREDLVAFVHESCASSVLEWEEALQAVRQGQRTLEGLTSVPAGERRTHVDIELLSLDRTPTPPGMTPDMELAPAA